MSARRTHGLVLVYNDEFHIGLNYDHNGNIRLVNVVDKTQDKCVGQFVPRSTGGYDSPTNSVEYRGYYIHKKRDFGESGYLKDGHKTYEGYTYGYGHGVTSVPGACWFSTVQDAKIGIECHLAITRGKVRELTHVEAQVWHQAYSESKAIGLAATMKHIKDKYSR